MWVQFKMDKKPSNMTWGEKHKIYSAHINVRENRQQNFEMMTQTTTLMLSLISKK